MDITRDRAVEILLESRSSLAALGPGLSEKEKSEPGSTGGDWSIKDLVGHITTWEELALDALADWKGGAPLRLTTLISSREELDRFNDEQLAKKTPMGWDEIDRASADTNRKLIEEIQALSDEDWGQKRKVEGRTRSLGELVSRILGAPESPFGHTKAHLDELGPPAI